jgi:hypothetical protein
MNHIEIRHKLSEYIDGAVTPQERAAIDEHLKTCTTCADALAELRKTIEQVKQIEEVEAPAWMTQKIMANVREVHEKRSGILNILFNYFVTGRAIRVAAVLFLTVTVYYIYSSMHPAEKYAEAPMGRLAKQEAPAETQDAAKRKAPVSAEQLKKKIAQEPGYKSLDMKYEYEKPAPPVPEAPGAGIVAARDESAASAPAKRSAPMMAKEEAALENKQAISKAFAPSVMAEQTAPSQEATRDAGKAAKKAKATAAADREADDTLEVTEHFVHTDLPDTMKVKGLRFNTRKISDDTPELQWLRKMPSYRNNSCESRFLVDVEFPGSSLKYLYCHDRAGIRLLGIFSLTDGVWSEKK